MADRVCFHNADGVLDAGLFRYGNGIRNHQIFDFHVRLLHSRKRNDLADIRVPVFSQVRMAAAEGR
jgi:hypothetical protein